MSVILDTYPVFLFFLHLLQTYIGQPCLLSVILCTCRTNQIYNTYFLISLYFFQTYIGQTCLMSVITFTWLIIPIYIASFMFFVCHKSGKPDTYCIWATCDRLLALLARRITGCRDLYMVLVLILLKMGGYVRVLCPLQCPFF